MIVRDADGIDHDVLAWDAQGGTTRCQQVFSWPYDHLDSPSPMSYVPPSRERVYAGKPNERTTCALCIGLT